VIDDGMGWCLIAGCARPESKDDGDMVKADWK
jgi:class 3 adenylate cyclase